VLCLVAHKLAQAVGNMPSLFVEKQLANQLSVDEQPANPPLVAWWLTINRLA